MSAPQSEDARAAHTAEGTTSGDGVTTGGTTLAECVPPSTTVRVPAAASDSMSAAGAGTGSNAAGASALVEHADARRHEPACYMLLANVAKRHNVGTLMRSCVAFGVKEMIFCGSARIATFGAQGTERFMRVKHKSKLRDAVSELKAAGVTICGIEITPDAQPVETHPFRGATAFLSGNEGDGLCDAHKALCDHFVYIRQVGNGTASLNVAIATSIVLHHFSVWARYPELPREGERDKYLVVAPTVKHGAETEGDLEIQAAREAARRAAADAQAELDAAGTLATCSLFEEEGEEEEEGEADA